MAFEDNSAQVIHAIDNAVGSLLDEIGGELEAQVKRNTRVDSSQTKGSWQYVVDEGEKKVTVGSPLQNAIWEEFGTGEHAIHGDGRKGRLELSRHYGKWT